MPVAKFVGLLVPEGMRSANQTHSQQAVQMNIVQVFFKSSIGKKVVMALTGVVLVGFVIGHLIGNLQIFLPAVNINTYAHLLRELGVGLWLIRGFLLLCLILHVWMAVLLVIENKKARPEGYEQQKTLRASYASRAMKVTGPIVFLFLIYHLLHFTFQTTPGDIYYQTTLPDGTEVMDVHTMMVLGFQSVWVSGFYILAVGLLSWHMRHGIYSIFQSIGIRTRSYANILEKAVIVFCVLYFLGNLAIPAAVLAGAVEIQNEEVAAMLAAHCDACAEAIAQK